MSTRASDRLVQAHKQSNIGYTQKIRAAKANLAEILQENEVYEDVIDQINRKLALRSAIDQASEAIERSKQGSNMDKASVAVASSKKSGPFEQRSKSSA